VSLQHIANATDVADVPDSKSGPRKDVRHPPSAERRTIALCVLEMTRGRGFAPNVRAANEWMRGSVAKGRMGVWNPFLQWIGGASLVINRVRQV
jgi:hypothetical protein